jgi:PAS domain S-box-containing protein
MNDTSALVPAAPSGPPVDPTLVVEAAFEHAIIGIALLDPEGRFLRANDAMSRVLALPRRNRTRLSYSDLLLPEDGEAEIARFRALVAGTVPAYQVEIRLRRRGRPPLWTRVSLAAVREPGPRLVILQLEDITSRHAADEATLVAHDALRRINTELEAFASVAAHDLREPLRKVLAFGDRIEVRFGDALGEQGLDYLHRMTRAAARMDSLIEALLAYARIGMTLPAFEPVALDAVVTEAMADVHTRLEESGGLVETAALPVVHGNDVLLRQLFTNLLTNALKYRDPGRPPVVRIEAGPAEGGAAWRVSVSDNGIGFEPRFADRIFAPFERLHGRDAYEGTGIGLAICRRIVEQHGGAITADGRPGDGATFTMTLPATAARAAR